MGKHRYQRMPKAKDNQLKVQWVGDTKDNRADMYFIHGKECHRCDARLINLAINEIIVPRTGKSLIDELEHRGYDITTFKLSIEKPKCDKNTLD